MTLTLEETDRFYKMSEVLIGNNLCRKFVSKIDKNGNITIFTYIFSRKDVRKDGTVSNKRSGMIIGPIPDIKYYDVIDYYKQHESRFDIVTELDYSDMTQEEAIKKIQDDNRFVVTKEDQDNG